MVKASYVDRNGVKRGAWSKEEDETLKAFVLRYNHKNWRLVSKLAGLSRCPKSCRLRWMNYLNPNIKRGPFTKEEHDLIIGLVEIHGTKWSTIASYLHGRTDNDIKNYYNGHIKKRMMPSKVTKGNINVGKKDTSSLDIDHSDDDFKTFMSKDFLTEDFNNSKSSVSSVVTSSYYSVNNVEAAHQENGSHDGLDSAINSYGIDRCLNLCTESLGSDNFDFGISPSERESMMMKSNDESDESFLLDILEMISSNL